MVPVSARNRRAKVRGDIATCAASVSTSRSSSRLLDDPLQQRAEGLGVAVGHGVLDELRLAAVAVRGYDDPPGRRRGDAGAEVVAHQVQRGVDAGGRAGAGEDVAVVAVEDVGADLGLGVHLREQVGVAPVRRALAAVEQPGGAELEGARAVRVERSRRARRRPGSPRARRGRGRGSRSAEPGRPGRRPRSPRARARRHVEVGAALDPARVAACRPGSRRPGCRPRGGRARPTPRPASRARTARRRPARSRRRSVHAARQPCVHRILAENQRRVAFLPLVAGSRREHDYCHDLPDHPPAWSPRCSAAETTVRCIIHDGRGPAAPAGLPLPGPRLRRARLRRGEGLLTAHQPGNRRRPGHLTVTGPSCVAVVSAVSSPPPVSFSRSACSASSEASEPPAVSAVARLLVGVARAAGVRRGLAGLDLGLRPRPAA